MKTKPAVSKDFTIDDIYIIREWHYRQRIEMGKEEYSKRLSQEVKSILADFPKAKILTLSD